jgi:hypothetical protein
VVNSAAAAESKIMGKIVDAILSPLVFNRHPVSFLVALLYGLVFASVFFSDSLPRVKYSKDFDQAVTDLTKVREKSWDWSPMSIQLTRSARLRPAPTHIYRTRTTA